MFSWKVVKSHQFFPVFGQALAGFGIVDLVEFQEFIEGFFSSGGEMNLVYAGFGLSLLFLRQLIENIGSLVNPATLMASPWKNLFQGRPET